ncbi:hypothetical protein FEM48_Zijuj01G0079100 [Ziziphus jujuba var. spinosa]|uniref:Uncharacterized protein n=1 Tax=Ziziphus jujuba var. spinosa TaxID=714518 RepID=A0A978W017_ZIZJJ|nr:hypothetical protein FEM48_Zijuj01G0079100 [Ziziphus jujuba var. spinosa]
MAPVLNLSPPPLTFSHLPRTRPELTRSSLCATTRRQNVSQDWNSLLLKLKCRGRFSCLFSDNRRQEEAKKALESALGGKKNEFEKWNKEIKRREEVGGGGDAGGGGWFGWGGRFGWSNGDHFWQEAQQTSLAVLGIVIMYLIVAKGEVMLAVILNPLLYALRGTRNGLTFITSKILRKTSPDSFNDFDITSNKEGVSAKDRVTRKWRSV